MIEILCVNTNTQVIHMYTILYPVYIDLLLLWDSLYQYLVYSTCTWYCTLPGTWISSQNTIWGCTCRIHENKIMSSTNSIAASVIAGLLGGLAGAALYQHLAKPANKKIATTKASPAGGHYRYTSCFILFIQLRLEFLFLFFFFFFSLSHSLTLLITSSPSLSVQPSSRCEWFCYDLRSSPNHTCWWQACW